MNIDSVALIIFNRPRQTEKIIKIIKKAKPKNFFLIADGPRENNTDDLNKCKQSLNIVKSNIDWDCNLNENISKKNLGCKLRVSSGLDWVFQHTDRCIILEDDTLPNLSFFIFCEELLNLYKNNNNVGIISGNNFLFNKIKIEDSYYFSKYVHIWGWATWRRVWLKYNVNADSWPYFKRSNQLNKILKNKNEIIKWNKNFQDVYDGKIDTWDYQLTLMCWKEKLLSIMPNKNLVSNIGFGSDATHTKSKNFLSNLENFRLNFPLKHPSKIEMNVKADEFKSFLFNKKIGIREKIINYLRGILNF